MWLILVVVAKKGEAKQESGLGRENLRFTYKNFQDTENTGKQTLRIHDHLEDFGRTLG